MAYTQGFRPHKTKVLNGAERAALADPRRCGFDRRTVKGRRDWAVVQLLRFSGMRAAEVAGLRHGHVREDEVAGEPALVLDFPGKGDKWREVVLVGAMASELRSWLARHPTPGRPADPVFPALTAQGRPRREPMTPDAVYQLVRRLGERIGVPGLHPHRFRHTVATVLAENDVPMPVIMQTLGHASPQTTMRYIACSRKHLGAALVTAAGAVA